MRNVAFFGIGVFCGVGCIVLVRVQKKSGLSCGPGNDGGILWKSLSLILNFG